MIQYFLIKLIVLLPVVLQAQNEVCFEIESNPDPFDPALNSFSKYVNVLDCFHIYGESQISDAKMLHAAAIVAELLDNDEDGIVDDYLLKAELQNSEAMMPIFNFEWPVEPAVISEKDKNFSNFKPKEVIL